MSKTFVDFTKEGIEANDAGIDANRIVDDADFETYFREADSAEWDENIDCLRISISDNAVSIETRIPLCVLNDLGFVRAAT